MTKKEAIQILQDREEQIAGFAKAFSEGNTFDWVGSVLKAVLSGVPEAIDVLREETK